LGIRCPVTDYPLGRDPQLFSPHRNSLGLHFDEGFQGVSTRGVIESRTPQIFFEGDMGEEPIAIYLVALAVMLLGPDPWAIRLPSAIIGTLTVPMAWWLGRELMILAGGRSQRKAAKLYHRDVQDRSRAMLEYNRVLKPWGRVFLRLAAYD
jgi:hypothetical protein